MTTGRLYRIHGLVIRSAVPLPLPSIGAAPVDVDYRATPGSGPRRAPRFTRSDDPEGPWVVERWHDRRLVVEFPGRAAFELSTDEVSLVLDETGDPDHVAHLLLDHVVPRVVALRGDLMLHAAGVVGPGGRAHVFVGRTGAGKSTLATALAAAGWGLLDDDGIRVSSGESGPLAVPGYAGVRLLPDAAHEVVPDLIPGRALGAGFAKRRFGADGRRLRMAAEPAPIAGVYVIRRAEVHAPHVDRMGFGEAVGAVSEHGFHLADEPESITRTAFERASELAAAVPVWRLTCPAGLDRLGSTRALLASLDGQQPALIS